ncbi:UDP-N-acetylglucosamine 2-epimerase [Achromatium sp. WMS3]|nr:UDP-N-acetylglucosamine 2-epimerase [Achromatium sp. WMS3]
MKRKICVVTTTRAEYGLLSSLIEKINDDSELLLQLIATGSHLSSEFGFTVNEIEEDGFTISKKIEMLLSSDTPIGISKSMGLALISFAEAFDDLKPDIVIVLGDRYELLPIVSAATMALIPVAHISGGEVTEGVLDDSIRHAVTKLSHIHFTSIEEYRKRVIQLGECPSHTFNVGEIGLDNFLKVSLFSKDEFEKSINTTLKKHNLLITYHPVTTQSLAANISAFSKILEALDSADDTLLIFTKSNADSGGRILNKMIDEYIEQHNDQAISFVSMGYQRYLSALRYVDAVIGNSSSGIVEAPSFKIGTINIGDRQKGRIQSKSVINCEPEIDAINKALKKLYSKSFKKTLESVTNYYGDGKSSERIVEILKNIDIKKITRKKFHDVDFDL